jgi:hypothetical protein
LLFRIPETDFCFEASGWRRILARCFPMLQSGMTALMFAAMRGKPESVRLLLEAGADKQAKDNVRDHTAYV